MSLHASSSQQPHDSSPATFLCLASPFLSHPRQAYNTGDLSKNNWWVGILAFGEGWHNNHHAFEFSARHGFEWWQVRRGAGAASAAVGGGQGHGPG